jgi:phage-related protein
MRSTDKDLEELPKDVKEEFVKGLTIARLGGTPDNMKPWKGEGSGVYELLEDLEGDTYRAVYTVRFKEAVYVLHVFKKKSKTGIKTPLPDIRKVTKRLKDAEEHYERTFKGKGNR